MRLPIGRADVVRLARFALAVEGTALLAAFVVGLVVTVLRPMALLDAFLLIVFLIFLLLFVYALLSGPGLFLSRPRFVPLAPGPQGRIRAWLTPPTPAGDREFFELVLYVGLAFLLLAIATGIAALAQRLGG